MNSDKPIIAIQNNYKGTVGIIGLIMGIASVKFGRNL